MANPLLRFVLSFFYNENGQFCFKDYSTGVSENSWRNPRASKVLDAEFNSHYLFICLFLHYLCFLLSTEEGKGHKEDRRKTQWKLDEQKHVSW